MDYYFIRVNGKTRHDNPKNPDCFVQKEDSRFTRFGYSNYLDYCFENDIVRIGWPRVGDLKTVYDTEPQPKGYNIMSIKPHIREYLFSFMNILPGSLLLVPNRDISGNLYVCKVVKGYYYDTSGLYDCAHRLGVNWDRDDNGTPILYTNEQFGISIGGWWRRAFHKIESPEVISRINERRSRIMGRNYRPMESPY
jgi:hypothetical protein